MRNLDLPDHLLPSWLKEIASGIDEVFFNEWASEHRQHQVEAIGSLTGKKKGQVSIPTGTGKTRCQAHLHVEGMITLTKSETTGVFVITSHRLLLNKQLLDNVVEVAAKTHLKFNVLFVGASKADKQEYNEMYKTTNIESEFTLSESVIKSFYEDTAAAGRHLLVVSTYNSLARLGSISSSINIITCDEAHILEGDFSQFKKTFADLSHKMDAKFFFTATRRVWGNLGMNNEEFYGKLEYSKSPRQMIEAMEIVTPVLHILRPVDNDSNYTNDDMMVMTVITGFSEHEKRLREVSAEPDRIGAKMMVCVEFNTERIHAIRLNSHFEKFCKDGNIRTFVFSSVNGGNYFVDGVKATRAQVMSAMNSMTDTEKAILLHIDILSEGIDIPAVTAILSFREMDDTKLIQTLGRGARLLKYDRDRFYHDEITSQESENFRHGLRHKLVKPCFFVLVPTFYENIGNDKILLEKIRKIHREYDLRAIEMRAIERGYSSVVTPLPDLPGGLNSNNGDTTDLEHIISTIEDDRDLQELDDTLATVTTEEQYLILIGAKNA